ncbi:MAG: ATP-binding protein [Kiloniellaceae bacterium]
MRLPIGTKLFGGFLAVILVTSAIAVVAIDRLSELDSILREVSKKEIPEVRTLSTIRTLLGEIETDLRRVLLSDEKDEYFLHIQKRHQIIREHLADFWKLNPTPAAEEERLLGYLTTHSRSFEQATARIGDLLIRGQAPNARALVLKDWKQLRQATLESLTRLIDYEKREIERKTVFAQTKSRWARNTVIVLAAAGILLSLALAAGITFSLTKPIADLVKATERVMQGDLASKAEIPRDDEIGLLARRFNEMLERLNESLSDQRRFCANVSHELRTPLTVIRGTAEVALRAPDQSIEEYRAGLKAVITVAGQMGRLCDELLFLARSEAGQIHYEMTEVALRPLLEDVTHQCETLTALKNVSLSLDGESSITVWGDPLHLRQLFLILVDNAIQYSRPDGKVALVLAVERDRARVKISDTGIGISDEELPHIFERFYRTDVARATREEGTGLGLSIAKSIVDIHQGEIDVKSARGRGTTVSVTFPRVSSQG